MANKITGPVGIGLSGIFDDAQAEIMYYREDDKVIAKLTITAPGALIKDSIELLHKAAHQATTRELIRITVAQSHSNPTPV